MSDKSIAVLIPCYNEEPTIGKVVDDFREALPDANVYVYNNNSTDNSEAIAKEHGAILVDCSLQGKGATVQQMFRDIDADLYLMVDADDTYPVDYASQLLDGVQSYDCDMVIGDRLSANYYQDNKRRFHGFGNALVKFLVNKMYGGKAVDITSGNTVIVTDIMTGYRVFNKKFVKGIDLKSNGFEIETEMTIKALQKGYKIGTMPVSYRDRPEGSYSKLSTFSDGKKVLKMIFSLYKTKGE